MTKHMLIDAAHPEEVRVCVLENNRVEDFDFEFSSRKPLRGNIYLARVTRVEPSLQAAFVEYGGNRHGFLAFSEIHPDYYQIPVSDRRLLQEAEAEEAALAAELGLESRDDARDFELEGDDEPSDDEGGDDDQRARPPRRARRAQSSMSADGATEADADAADSEDQSAEEVEADQGADAQAVDDVAESPESESSDPDVSPSTPAAFRADADPVSSEPYAQTEEAGAVDAQEGAQDAVAAPSADSKPATRSKRRARGGDSSGGAKRGELLERYRQARNKRQRLLRNYKIQEVIKRRQIMLVQVVKEERGNKGAALTTYMSLAGRYCVLMPNTARGGGISRKIGVTADRKRLKSVVDSLEVPDGMGLIIRTAGAKRTKAEIKRDYDYLIRLWENIRSLTLQSIAPCLINEEANLIKRAIRDLYDKDIETVTVEGEAGYREAKEFMKMLMPSHAKNVRQHKDKTPLFLAHDVESQLDGMYEPTVRLKSGGYIVIHQTEALVAIDVNSGKATRERNIEQTALKTNLEAAREAARQCRLRDLAGLIVVDFIDMEEARNNRAVEKRFKDALKTDRARIQVGRISNFGLLEMSRQRRRSGIVDGTTHVCASCNGAGVVRSSEMAALRILRAIEQAALRERAAVIAVKASLDVTLYILNHKRAWLKRIEDDYAVSVEIAADMSKSGDAFDLEKRGAPRDLAAAPAVRADVVEAASEPALEPSDDEDNTDADQDGAPRAPSQSRAEQPGEGGRRKRRRRRRGGRRDDQGGEARPASQREAAEDVAGSDIDDDRSEADDAGEENGEDKAGVEGRAANGEGGDRARRRRGRRGGRRNRGRSEDGAANGAVERNAAHEIETADREPGDSAVVTERAEPSDQPFIRWDEAAQPRAEAPTAPPPPEPRAPLVFEPAAPAPEPAERPLHPIHQPTPEPTASEKPAKEGRKGWWSRALGG